MEILVTKDLCKRYGGGDNAVHALNHVSLTLEEGEFVSIVGSSGSGKSTFLNLVGGLAGQADLGRGMGAGPRPGKT